MMNRWEDDRNSLLSADILYQVFKFFVSKSKGAVDGESLRVVSLVCKQWKTVADSKPLWATLSGINDLGVNCHSHSVHRSLLIKEATDSLVDGISLHASLIGFVKLKLYDGKHLGLNFFVRERATGYKLLLSISRDEQKHRSLIRDLYVNHFELNEKFLLHEGICMWKGRVVQWYRSGNEMEARSTINHVSAKRKHSSQNFEVFIQPSISLVSHLIELEKDGLRDVDYGSFFYVQGRQDIVDWMAEITECFDLEDSTIFQSMLLFDRFITSNHLNVSSKHYQLVAGSCLLIASKCNKSSITEKDISFCCDNLFSTSQILATETEILKRLNWKLAYPSTIEFLTAFSTILGFDINSRFFSLGCYILELSLFLDISLRYPPSKIAASSIILINYFLRKGSISTLWPKELEIDSGLKLKDDLFSCAAQLSKEIEDIRRAAAPELKMIYKRYSKPSRHSVSEIYISVLSPSILQDLY
mmetsp:Transcript_2708/g.2985  ORF Transcript_2708/g.2985 Transcript_2708/m.2985 type:complete len:473 (+) Transcript_2708:91-1509(+)